MKVNGLKWGIFLMIIGILFSQNSIAQNSLRPSLDPSKSFSQYAYDHWNLENGLPDNVIQDIIKANDGYIWIATSDGLARYDGVKFDYYDRDLSTVFENSQEILSLFQENNGTLWMGTKNGSVIRYMNGEFKLIKISQSNSFIAVSGFAQTADGTIWVGTNSGLYKIVDQDIIQLDNFPSLKNLAVNHLYVDDEDNLWISSANAGLIKKSETYIKQFTTKDGLTSNSIWTVRQDQNGHLWVGTDTGIMKIEDFKYIDISKKFEIIPSTVHEIIIDEVGTVYAGTDLGLIRIQNDEIEIFDESNGLSNNLVSTIMDDEEQGIWIGTQKGGVVRIKDGSFLNYGIQEGICNNIVNVIYEDDSVYWIGTEYGISKFENGEFTTLRIPNQPNHNRIKDFVKDHDGNLWVATYCGLFQIKDDQLINILSTHSGLTSSIVRSLLVDADSNLWIGTSNGVNIIRDDELEIIDQQDGLLNTFITNMKMDGNGRVWIGTNGGGLSIYDNGKIITYTDRDGLPANAVFDIWVDEEKLVWISTSKGICSFDGERFVTYKGINEVIKKSVFQILEDKNKKLWLTSPKGIFVIQKSDLFTFGNDKDAVIDKIKLYDHTYGLRSNSITGNSKALIDKDGKFWFPTLKGVSIIDPANLKINQNPPKVAIEKIVINGLEVPFHDRLRIEAGGRNIEIHYTGLNYIASDRIKFKYQLKNLDKDWVNAGQRRVAYYHNIPPGNYEFLVKAANDDGIWNENVASVAITQDAYFYKTNWFYAMVVLVVLALGVFGYTLKVRNFRIMNEQLTIQVQERTRDLEKQKEELQRINSTKDKLLSIISHDLKGPLNSTKQMLNLLGSGHLTPDELKQLTNNITRDVGVSVNLLDNLLNWAKSQMHGIRVSTVKIDIHEIVKENFQLFNYNFNNKNITSSNQVPEGEIAFADYEMIKLVIRNLIANALKFTPEGGSISVSTQRNGKFVEVAVSDTGIGISEKNQKSLFQVKETFTKIDNTKEAGTGLGLLLSKEFIEKNGGKIWVESEKDKGSTFRFTLKVQES